MKNQICKILAWSYFTLILYGCKPSIDTPLFYQVAGSSKSKIVFLHGLLGSHVYWDQVVPILSINHQLILLDLLGFGDSPKPNANYTVNEHLEKISEVINSTLPTEKYFTLVGHSMGAILALNYATLHPNQVQKLILINAPMVTDEQDLKKTIAESSSKLMATMTFDQTWGKLVCKIHEVLPLLSYPFIRILEPDLPPAVAKAAGQHTWDSYSGSFEHVLLEQDFFKLISKVHFIPILIIASSDDEYTKVATLKRLPESKNIQVVLLKGDHNVLLHQPEQIANEIQRFVKN